MIKHAEWPNHNLWAEHAEWPPFPVTVRFYTVQLID